MVNVIKSPVINEIDSYTSKEIELNQPNNENKKLFLLYIYRLPNYQNHGFKVGMTTCKIGETFWDAIKKRIAVQDHEVALPDPQEYKKYGQDREVVFWGICLDAKSDSFKDYYVHRRILQECAGLTEKEQEWFTGVTLEKLIDAFKKCRERGEKFLYTPREEQKKCVNKLLTYFQKNPVGGKFLMNCKMRFGKCFTTYYYAEKANLNKILVLTFVPAVEDSWRDDLNHIEKNYDYFTDNDLSNPNFSLKEQQNPYVLFLSLQNLLGKDRNTKETKEKLRILKDIPFDLVVLDEYHFGAWNNRTQEKFEDVSEDYQKNLSEMIGRSKDNLAVLDRLSISTKEKICLSGTPFKALARGEFTKENTYAYTYFDEQKNKYPDPQNRKLVNPDYAQFPDIRIMGYNMRTLFPSLPFLMMNERALFNRKFFSLNGFFETEKDKNKEQPAKFIYEDSVKTWLDILVGGSAFNGEYPYRGDLFDANKGHSLWLLPTQNACKAMEDLLKKDPFFNRYEIINLSQPDVGSGVGAKKYLDLGIQRSINLAKPGSIALTVNKLTIGVTVKEWSNIFVLKDCSSPEQYFQSIFRIQTPWKNPDGTIRKKYGNVFDFNIDRAAALMLKYADQADQDQQMTKLDIAKLIVRYMPIFVNGNMSEPISENVFYELAQNGDSFGRSLSSRITDISKTTRAEDPQVLSEMIDDPKVSPILKKVFAHAKLSKPKTRTYADHVSPSEGTEEFGKRVAQGYVWGERDYKQYLDFNSSEIQEAFDRNLEKEIQNYLNTPGSDHDPNFENGIRKGYERGTNAPVKKLNCGRDDGIKFADEVKKYLGQNIIYCEDTRMRIGMFINKYLNAPEHIPEQYRNKCLYDRWYKDSFRRACISQLKVKEKSDTTLEEAQNIIRHILARLFEFLYISVYRETTFEDVFKNADPQVFLSAVGITKEDFVTLNKYRIFQEQVLNNCIHEFFVNESIGQSLNMDDPEVKKDYRNSFNWFGYGIIDK